MFSFLLIALTGCISDVHQTAGTGAIYPSRCSAVMLATDDGFVTQCTPPPCSDRFRSTQTSHVVVAMDPGKKVIGYAERSCYQDLSEAAGLFPPTSAAQLTETKLNEAEAEDDGSEQPEAATEEQ